MKVNWKELFIAVGVYGFFYVVYKLIGFEALTVLLLTSIVWKLSLPIQAKKQVVSKENELTDMLLDVIDHPNDYPMLDLEYDIRPDWSITEIVIRVKEK